MTFDTFDKYNTDEAYKDSGTSAKGLVDAYKKDNPEGTADDFYAKLNKTWKEDKNGYVKKAVDEAFKAKEETPKAEEPEQTTEEAMAENVLEESKPEETKKERLTAPSLSKSEEKYINDQNTRSENAEVKELNKIADRSDYNYKSMYDTTARMSEAYKNIDDKLISQLPTFLFRRYQNGEFGDISDTSTPEGRESKKNAQLRLAHFILNGVQSKLKNASNAFMVTAGRSPLYSDTMSDYEKYQQSNFAKGMENRWRKYEAETNNAIELASKETMTEQEARHAVEQLTRTQNMNTMWNTMDENQKLYAMEVTKKLGDYLGKMDISELADFIAGAAYEGKMDKDKVVAIGIAKIAEKFPDVINNLPEGNIKDMVFSFIGGGEMPIMAGIGGAGGDEKEEGNDSNSATAIKLSDGTTLDVGKMMSLNDFSQISNVAKDLSDRYYRGEITENEFRDDYNKLYNLVQSHNIMNKITGVLKPVDKRVKELNGERVGYWDRQIEDLNNKAKNGLIKPSDYAEKFAEFEKSLVNAGGDAKKTAKKKLSTEAIIKANEKIDKEKKKRR